MRPVSIVTVSNGGFFFVRLLVERVRAHIGNRPYEILVVDRGGSRAERNWLAAQPDVVLLDSYGVARETGGEITRENYLLPLQARLRSHYHLDY